MARPLTGGTVDAADDHRLAMAFAIAATRRGQPTTILGRVVGRRLVSRVLRRARAADAVTADKIYLVGFMAAGKTTVARAWRRGSAGAPRTSTS